MIIAKRIIQFHHVDHEKIEFYGSGRKSNPGFQSQWLATYQLSHRVSTFFNLWRETDFINMIHRGPTDEKYENPFK